MNVATLRQQFEAKLQNLDTSYQSAKAQIEGEMAEVGPFLEHEIEHLRAWIAAVAKHI
jgi:hypothetical protein